jgi:hypothetical protein
MKIEIASNIRVIPRQLNQAMTPMVTDLSDYFLQLTLINHKKMYHPC